MTIEERALRTLADANPIPDEGTLELDSNPARYLANLEQRSAEMTQLDTKTRIQRGQGRSALPWLSAAAVVVIVAAALLLVARPTEEPVSEAEAIALAFIEARNAYDGEAMRHLLAPDALITGEGALVPDPGGYLMMAAFEQAIGVVYHVDSCIENLVSDVVRVFCPYEVESTWSQALGLEPAPLNNFRFTIVDGEIQIFHNDINFNALGPIQSEFGSWLEENHPDELARMFAPGDFGVPMPVITTATVDLFERYSAEFLAEMTGDTGS